MRRNTCRYSDTRIHSDDLYRLSKCQCVVSVCVEFKTDTTNVAAFLMGNAVEHGTIGGIFGKSIEQSSDVTIHCHGCIFIDYRSINSSTIAHRLQKTRGEKPFLHSTKYEKVMEKMVPFPLNSDLISDQPWLEPFFNWKRELIRLWQQGKTTSIR